jgi:DNA-binding response OmpR family regulator
MKNILLVEDEVSMAATLKEGLNRYGYNVMHTAKAVQARAIDISKFDLVVLDWMLDSLTGIDILKHWRSCGYSTPVLMLTAKTTTDDKVKGFESGADDYVSKFFEWEELNARIGALIRRHSGLQLSQLDNITLDRENKLFLENNSPVNFTNSEYKILKYFFNNPKRVINKEELIAYLYKNQEEPQSNVIERHIKSIRSKISYDPFITIRSLGYRLRSQ